MQLLQGNCLDVLRTLPDGSVHCCVTSPPYFGLRRYLPPEAVRLRADLTDHEVEYVFSELKKHGVKPAGEWSI